MNKKGFTLVELLTVIILLSLIAIITTPVIIGVLQQSKADLSNRQIAIVESAAEKWGVQNYKNLSKYKSGGCYLEFADLRSFLSSTTVKDTLTGDDLEGYIRVIYEDETKQFIYKYETDNSVKPSNQCTK